MDPRDATPTVSIAIRASRRRWLGEAIASVLAQTYRDLELVVYDDAGDLEDVVAGFADPRIRYHRAERKLQESGRFDAAAALCRGRYIGMLDDDDLYAPEFVERLVAALEDDGEAGIAFCHNVWEVEGEFHPAVDGLPAGRQPDSPGGLIRARWRTTPSLMLIRRTALADADRLQPMPDGVAPDVFVNVRVALAGWHHVLVDDVLVTCRWHSAQISREGGEGDERSIATMNELRLGDPGLARLRDERLAEARIGRALFSLRGGDRLTARSYLRAAAEADASVHARTRRLAGLAAAVPGAGVVLPVLHRIKRRVHRRDRLPPGVRSSGGAGRQVARDAASLAAGTVAAQVLTVLAAPLLTRLYDPSDVGAASVLAGAMIFVGPVACMRFDVAIPLARGARDAGRLCALCLLCAAVSTLVLGLVAALFGQALCDAAGASRVGPYVWLVPLYAAVSAVGLVGAGLLIRARRYGGLARARFSQALGQSGTQLGGGAAGGGAAWFAGGAVAGAAGYALAAATLARPPRGAVAEAFGGVGGAARSWRRFAAWSAGASSLQGASLAIPAILVTAIYGPAAGGLFVITQRVLGLPVNLVSEAVGGAWSGTAAEIVRSDRGSLRPAFVAVTRSLLLGGGAILAVVLVAGPPLFGPVFGGHWHGGGELILVLAPLHFSLLAAVPAGQTLQARGRTDLLMRVAAARLAAPVLGIAGGHAIGLPLTASLAIYAGAMATISAVNAVMAWRLSA